MKLFAGQVEVRETDTIKVYQDWLEVVDKNGKLVYRKNRDGEKWKFNKNGNVIYYENSYEYWEKREFNENGNVTYYENSYGKIIDNRLKEMTPLQALEKLTSNEPMTAEEFDNSVEIIKRSLLKLDSLEKFKATFDRYELAKKQDFIAYENWLECEAELKKSPTVDEVCVALSECEDLDKHSFITYMPEDNSFTLFKQVRADDCYEIDLVRYEQGTIHIAKYYSPHLVTLIGRFYEGE